MNSDTTAALRAANAGDENNANVGDDARRPSPKSVVTNATNFDDHKNTNNDEPGPEQATVALHESQNLIFGTFWPRKIRKSEKKIH